MDQSESMGRLLAVLYSPVFMSRILVTNDDGIRSDGLESLAVALEELGDVVAVAPLLESSAISHSLTLRRPLRLERIARQRFAVDGTPADCVNVALVKLLGGLPDVVVSGINKGANVGDDVFYSGTIAGAMEATLLGIPSLAISLERTANPFNFSQACSVAVSLTKSVLSERLPERTVLNVNVPERPAKGIRITVQGRRNPVSSLADRLDPRKEPYFWIQQGKAHWEEMEHSDHHALTDGWISITPLQSDLTNHAALGLLADLSRTQSTEVE